jgi:hypothetical protein
VIQGEPQSFSIDFSSPEIFDPYEEMTTPFSLRIKEYRVGTDSVRAEVTIKSVASHDQESASIFLAYAEDTVFYSAPNGENQHIDVFRKAFTPVQGSPVSLPATGDSIIVTYAIPVDGEWNMNRMKVIGIMQDPESKSVLQAGVTSSVEYPSFIFSANKKNGEMLGVFPNPATSFITVEKAEGIIEIFTMDGKTMERIDVGDYAINRRIDVSNLERGLYIIKNNISIAFLSKQ